MITYEERKELLTLLIKEASTTDPEELAIYILKNDYDYSPAVISRTVASMQMSNGFAVYGEDIQYFMENPPVQPPLIVDLKEN